MSLDLLPGVLQLAKQLERVVLTPWKRFSNRTGYTFWRRPVDLYECTSF